MLLRGFRGIMLVIEVAVMVLELCVYMLSCMTRGVSQEASGW